MRQITAGVFGICLVAAVMLAPSAVAVAQVAVGTSDRANSASANYRRPRTDSQLSEGVVARGSRNILAAWFSDPVTRYRHFALGSEREPATLVVSTSDRRVLRLTLPVDSVFEDREPRIVDLDGDGRDAILVVRSYLKTGAALAVVRVLDGTLAIVAETPPLGAPFKWLNPIGVADFLGDGSRTIALVTTPEADGVLELWRLAGNGLARVTSVDDVSTHAPGSPSLHLAAIADFNGDAVADVAVPSSDRRTLRFITFKGGRARQFGDAYLAAQASSDFHLVQQNGRAAVAVGIAGGRNLVAAP